MTDTPTIIGAFVTIILAFLAVAKIMLSQASKDREAASKDREADREERKKLSNAITLMAENSNKVAEATNRGSNEAKARNGHLAELFIQQGEKIIDAVQNVDVQKVEHQVVKDVKVKE